MLRMNVEKFLKNLGLNSYEIRIWAALLSSKEATAGELSDAANVPRSRSYDVLESLERKGFVAAKRGKPIRYISISPKKAIENSKASLNRKAAAEVRSLDGLKNTNIMPELTETHSRGSVFIERQDKTATIKGKTNILNQITNILNRAEESVLISTTPAELINLSTTFSRLFTKLSSKNVKIKIFTQSCTETQKCADRLKGLAEIIYTNTPSRFVIVDGKEIIFMVLNETEIHPAYDVGILANTPLAADLATIMLN